MVGLGNFAKTKNLLRSTELFLKQKTPNRFGVFFIGDLLNQFLIFCSHFQALDKPSSNVDWAFHPNTLFALSVLA